tara:strand:+ start:515 stop:709 length:195 start_codon:yes stop_codon:yes gene_type:complete
LLRFGIKTDAFVADNPISDHEVFMSQTMGFVCLLPQTFTGHGHQFAKFVLLDQQAKRFLICFVG